MKKFDPIESFANLRHEFGEHGGVNMSVEASTTFTVIDPTTMPEIFQGHLGPDVGGCYLYGRHFNPTVYVLGRQIAAYEGAQAGYCSASGLSAIAATIMQLCNTGDHVVASRTVYGGTFAMLHDYLPAKAGVTTSFVDESDLTAVEQAFTPQTRVLFCETVSNPTLRVADIPMLAKIAHHPIMNKTIPGTERSAKMPIVFQSERTNSGSRTGSGGDSSPINTDRSNPSRRMRAS